MRVFTGRIAHRIAEDFICGDDGLYVFWPKPGNGAFSAHTLRWVADLLDWVNQPWVDHINTFHRTISPGLEAALEKAREWDRTTTPQQKAEMYRAQRESFARGMAPCEHGVLDWETCPDCLTLWRNSGS